MKIAILINRSANGGRGGDRWNSIKENVLKHLEQEIVLRPYEVPVDLSDMVRDLIYNEQIRNFISAGGDGSLNYLINTLIEIRGEQLGDFGIGGIGLGSSNDFHYQSSRKLGSVPIRIDSKHKRLHDIGRIDYVDQKGEQRTRYFLLHASFGILAEGNRIFNESDRFLTWLKGNSMNTAVAYTAVKAFLHYQNIPLRVRYDNYSKKGNFTNITVTNTPLVSGKFLFDHSIRGDDRQLGVFMAKDLNRTKIIQTILGLLSGEFPEKPGRCKAFVQKLAVDSDSAITVEVDGEHFKGHSFSMTIVPAAVPVME